MRKLVSVGMATLASLLLIFVLVFTSIGVVINNETFVNNEFTKLAVGSKMGISNADLVTSFNRLVDYQYDRLNPRTSDRPLVTGRIDKSSVTLFIAASSFLFILSAAALGRLCFLLSLPTLGVLFAYSYSKRFTPFSHLFLGLAIGLAPLGAWVAVSGTLDLEILPLSLALLTYISGFDILYACQDIEFDRRAQLFSFPASFGTDRALWWSSVLHVLTLVFLLALFFIFKLHWIYLVFLFLIGMLLALEHWLVRPDRLDRSCRPPDQAPAGRAG